MTEMIVTDPERREAAIRALQAANVEQGERLIDFADTVLAGVADLGDDDLDDYSGQVTETYDSAVPVYHADVLATISEDTGLMRREPELGPASGSNFDGSASMLNLAAAVLYELGSEIAGAAVRERQEALEDAGAES